jgi:hypothetical protein
MSSTKVVRVSYTVDDVFCIPKNINLEDETQVKFWGVKYNVLYITLVNGKELKIESKGDVSSISYKYPSEMEIVDNEEYELDIDDEGFDEIELENGNDE